MHMLPKSQDSGFYKHSADSKYHIDYTMVDTPNPEDVNFFPHSCLTWEVHWLFVFMQVVPVVMQPGDALFFTAHTAHYTPANVTESR